MPAWSVAEWRARIGSSWCALGRPFKTRSPFRNGSGKRQRVFTVNQVLTLIVLLMMFIGLNYGLCTLVQRYRHHPFLNFLKVGGSLPSRDCLINVGLFLALVLQITAALVYQWVSTAAGVSQKFSGGLIFESLCFNTYSFYYLLFLVLKISGPSLYPVHWLTLTVFVHALDWLNALSSFKTALAVRQLEMICNDHASKGSEDCGCLWILVVVKASLDVVMSVAASVILSLLLISGDVEENPGPGDLDYNEVNAEQILDEDDIQDVMEEVISIKLVWYELGECLRLRDDDLDEIQWTHPNKSNSKKALKKVLLLWLQRKYKVERFGPPTWKMLVEAVDKKTGGNDHALAMEIAANHPKDATDATGATGAQGEKNVGTRTSTKEEALLTDKDIKEVLDLSWPRRARWRFIGIELGIEQGDLEAISVNNRNVDDCLREMMKTWLRKITPKPTRGALSAALQCERVSVNKLDSYTAHLKTQYKNKKQGCSISESEGNWPPPIISRVFRLAMIMAEKVERLKIVDDFIRQTITGKVDDILKKKIPIKLSQVFDKIEAGQRKAVLLEGGPGCGKSTLALHICSEWAEGNLFKEYKQVILVKLREKSVQRATSIADLLPKKTISMGQEIEEELIACNGEGVLFILDGWDELPKGADGRSVILDILEGTRLPKSSVIITSRPTSSASLYRVVKNRVEVLGFTKQELKEYFSFCLDKNVDNVKALLQKIQENPVIAGSCCLPLNASILVHLYKYAGLDLPKTQFGIFSSLARNCIYRHEIKTKGAESISRIKSLEELPKHLEPHFKELCRLAYEGVMEDRIIFEDLPANFNTLGLLQGVESFADGGMTHSYNFLHLSIQELLAAIYMATQLKPDEQVKQFRELFGRARFSAVFQYYSAKTKLKTPGIHAVMVEAVEKCLDDPSGITELTPSNADDFAYMLDDSDDESDDSSSDSTSDDESDDSSSDSTSDDESNDSSSSANEPQPLLVSLLHCLYEAQDEDLYQSVIKQFKTSKLDLSNISLNPADCLVVGTFLAHTKQFDVDLKSCSIGDDGCKTLFRLDAGETYDLCTLNLRSNSIGHEGAMAVAAAMTATNLRVLSLHDNSIGHEGAMAVAAAMTANLQELDLGANSIGDEGAMAVAAAMTANLQRLSLGANSIGDEGAMAVAAAMKTATLQKLYLTSNSIDDEGAMAVAAAMTANLQVLHLGDNSIGHEGAMAVAAAMKTATNLRELDLQVNDIGEEGKAAIRAAAKETGTELEIFGI